MDQVKAKVLIVDDEIDIVESLALYLNPHYEIDKAYNGVEALEKLTQKTFDVVVCDFLMPKMDGITLLKKIRASKNYTPFIFLSGNADNRHELMMASLGAYELLLKTRILEIPDVIKKTLIASAEAKKLRESGKSDDEFTKILHDS